MALKRISAVVLATSLLGGVALAQEVSQAEVSGMVDRLKTCWVIPPEALNSGLSVTLSVAFNRDGSVASTEVINPGTSELERNLEEGAVRAVERCAPYSLSADTYEQWKQVEIDLRP
ncbi:hypothetical protein [Devosia sp. 2618]|uniref:energy transducer TonB n=1 Tax=Devosia sp. 2618 TaxID=3156454 RepID=UPI00339832DD